MAPAGSPPTRPEIGWSDSVAFRHVGQRREPLRAERGGLRAHPVELVRGQGAQHRVGRLPARRQHDEVAQPMKVALDFAGIAVTLRLWGEMRLIEAGALQVMRGNS